MYFAAEMKGMKGSLPHYCAFVCTPFHFSNQPTNQQTDSLPIAYTLLPLLSMPFAVVILLLCAVLVITTESPTSIDLAVVYRVRVSVLMAIPSTCDDVHLVGISTDRNQLW